MMNLEEEFKNDRYSWLHAIQSEGYGVVETTTLYKCNDCGSVVVDLSLHDYFHDELNEATAEAFTFNSDGDAVIRNKEHE